MKRKIKQILAAIVIGNVSIFLIMAYFEKLPTDAHSSVFIDFWGRLGVYSLWFVGYGVYRKYIVGNSIVRNFVIAGLIINVPLFLGLAYFDKLSPAPKDLPFVDFWGRITVYSVWFVAYEAYRHYLQDDNSPLKGASA